MIFDEPRALPPRRSHDHQINLKEETQPLSVKPYRYLYCQNSEIEKDVRELLEFGVIRSSQSPFSSPFMLMRKPDGCW